MKAHPEAKKFRKRNLVHFDILYELCANRSATREYALTSNLTLQSEAQLQPSQSIQSQMSSSPASWIAKPNSSYNTLPLETYVVSREGS